MFVWIDPPGENPGWVHEVADVENATMDAVRDQHDIPADNDARQAAYDASRSGPNEASPQEYQAGRDFWGVTVLSVLPTDLPEGIVMVGRGEVL